MVHAVMLERGLGCSKYSVIFGEVKFWSTSAAVQVC